MRFLIAFLLLVGLAGGLGWLSSQLAGTLLGPGLLFGGLVWLGRGRGRGTTPKHKHSA